MKYNLESFYYKNRTEEDEENPEFLDPLDGGDDDIYGQPGNFPGEDDDTYGDGSLPIELEELEDIKGDNKTEK